MITSKLGGPIILLFKLVMLASSKSCFLWDCLCKLYVYHLSCFVRVSVWQRKPSPALRQWTPLTVPGVDHYRRRGISSYLHLLGQRHHNHEGDSFFSPNWMTEDSTRLGNNHDHTLLQKEGIRSEEQDWEWGEESKLSADFCHTATRQGDCVSGLHLRLFI